MAATGHPPTATLRHIACRWLIATPMAGGAVAVASAATAAPQDHSPPGWIAAGLMALLLLAAAVCCLACVLRRRGRSLGEAENHRALLTTLLDATPDIVFHKDMQGRYLIVNRALAEFLKQPIDQIVGKFDHELFPADLADDFRTRDQQVTSQTAVVRSTEKFDLEDGSQEVFDTVKAPVLQADGSPIGVIGIARQVTAEHQVSDRLKLAAQVFQNASEGIIITGPDATIEMINPA
ncbi:MAG: PAS domain-containing protein, partial [Rhodocyclaceae bacterium]|nr:PAS domain-containing protein [Rhodocyclaceae bacterium]